MSIEQQLCEYLLAHVPLSAVIGEGKVFFVQAPQGTKYDYVVVNKITGGQLRKVGFGSPLFQASYFSRSEYRALAGAEILVAALDGYRGKWGTTVVVGNYQDDRVLAEDGDIFHAPVEIRLNYLEV